MLKIKKEKFDIIYDDESKKMDLSRLNLKKLPLEILDYDIEHLNLGLNDLEEFPREIYQLKQLKSISFKSAFIIRSKNPVVNNLEDFQGLKELKHLEKIVLHYNMLSEFKKEITALVPKNCKLSNS